MQAIDILIEPSELEEYLKKGAVLLDARKAGEFKKGRIPGAMPFSTYDEFVPDTTLEGMKKFADAMAGRFSSVGVTTEKNVIIYDDTTGERAARELWILEYMGHQRAHMLHGGLKQWAAEGGAVIADTDIPTVRSKQLPLSVASGCLATADDINRRKGSWNFVVIDVRNDAEWSGKDNTACCERRGHIPRSVHIEWTRFLDNGRFKPLDAIMALLKEHHINPAHDIIPYCHRGARSATTYFALRYAGVTGARNYIGSWHEWSARTDLPIDGPA